jgi:micrococcal nuclease
MKCLEKILSERGKLFNNKRMKKWIIFFLLQTTTLFAHCVHDAKTFRCVEYLKNYDADTITVKIPDVHPLIGERVSVRVLGIDAPEIKTANKCEKEKARTAQKLVANILKHAKKISLEDVARDKYFRILARVQVDGQDLSALLIKNGLAVPYDGKTKSVVDWCKTVRDIASKK